MGADMLIAVTKAPVYENQDDPRNQPEFVTDMGKIEARVKQADYTKWARELLLELLLEDEGCRWSELVPEHVQERLEEGITDLIPRDEHGAPEYTEEEFDWSTIFTDDQVTETVMKTVVDIMENQRQTSWVCLDDKWYVMSGGLSRGDAPTDACEPIWFVHELGLFDEPFPR